ncbi:helix-turn-helix domain-containing protein [Planosporangium mesophilum]|nr:helix-turn-helix transcriptional regulator [Planosporangium mesophilum]
MPRDGQAGADGGPHALVRLSFGELVARRRRDLGLSQNQLADRICALSGRSTLTRHEVSRYERGVRLPGQTFLVAYAAALDLQPVVLVRAVHVARARRQTRAPGRDDTHRPVASVSSTRPFSGTSERLGDGNEYRSPEPDEKPAVPSDGWRVKLILRIGESSGIADEPVFVLVVRPRADLSVSQTRDHRDFWASPRP